MRLLTDHLLEDFKAAIDFDPMDTLTKRKDEDVGVDYFDFYRSVSTVYSSKIEGEEIDFDSYYKHRFLGISFQPDHTQRADDLFEAYTFISENEMEKTSILQAHAVLSRHLLPIVHQGRIRTNEMVVVGEDDRIDYVACNKEEVEQEFEQFCIELNALSAMTLSVIDTFYYSALIHLVFVKIHPMQDGNGRLGRLLEKWFLITKLGIDATAIESEKNYYVNRKEYYRNLRILGLDYRGSAYEKSLDLLLMTIGSLKA